MERKAATSDSYFPHNKICSLQRNGDWVSSCLKKFDRKERKRESLIFFYINQKTKRRSVIRNHPGRFYI